MSGRQGGKLKPLKAPKAKESVETEDDKAFREKKKAADKAVKDAQAKLAAKKKWTFSRGNIFLIKIWNQKWKLMST